MCTTFFYRRTVIDEPILGPPPGLVSVQACHLCPNNAAYAAEYGYQQMMFGDLPGAMATLKKAASLDEGSDDVKSAGLRAALDQTHCPSFLVMWNIVCLGRPFLLSLPSPRPPFPLVGHATPH